MIYVEDIKVAAYLEDLGYLPREMIPGGTFNRRSTFIYCYNESPRVRQLLSLIESGSIG